MTIPSISHTPIAFGSRHASQMTLDTAMVRLRNLGFRKIPSNNADKFQYFRFYNEVTGDPVKSIKFPLTLKSDDTLPKNLAYRVEKVIKDSIAHVRKFSNYKRPDEKLT